MAGGRRPLYLPKEPAGEKAARKKREEAKRNKARSLSPIGNGNGNEGGVTAMATKLSFSYSRDLGLAS